MAVLTDVLKFDMDGSLEFSWGLAICKSKKKKIYLGTNNIIIHLVTQACWEIIMHKGVHAHYLTY